MRYYNKLRFFAASVILLLLGSVSQAQVVEMYDQGFELGEPTSYTAVPANTIVPTTDMYASGARSLDIAQSTTIDDTVILQTLDFSTNISLTYISLSFDHICSVDKNTLPGGNIQNDICRMYYKLENQSRWTQITGQDIDPAFPSNSDFQTMGSFTKHTYGDYWEGVIDNEMWKSEHFCLNTVLNNVPQNERKLQIMFVVRKKVGSGRAGHWWIDNIRVRASNNLMVPPTITMVSYPDGGAYPTSRGARIVLDADGYGTLGINPDSVYIIYKVGSAENAPQHRLQMSPVQGVAKRYAATLPFEGYDTLMQFYCVARDNSTNANMMTFPERADSWVTFWHVRGTVQPGIATPAFSSTTGNTYVPFPTWADYRAEWVYDSALMAQGGYKASSITAMRFAFNGHSLPTSRSRVQIRMKNAPANYVADTVGEPPFTSSYMKVVYDGPLSTIEGDAGVEQTITLQDTFFYAGNDLVFQLISHNDEDHSSVNMRDIPAPPGKRTIIKTDGSAEWNTNVFLESNLNGAFRNADYVYSRRPAFILTAVANQPLLYDAGISELVAPNAENPMTSRPGSLRVKLKNFGERTLQKVVISYSIDGAAPSHYEWNGSLAAGREQNVTLSNTVRIPAGYHTFCAWVEDTVTSQSHKYRDHEPLNDTMRTQFVMCDGPLAGVRHVGGSTPNFNNIEELLFALQNCGIGDSLIVKIAPGQWPAFSMPTISGLSAQHYIVFEPESSDVVLYSDDSNPLTSIVDLTRVSNIRFRNITFSRRSGMLTNMASLSETSHNCHFVNCRFVDSLATPTAQELISNMIGSGFSNGLTVNGCTFVGGKVGVFLSGLASDILATGGSVRNSIFRGQVESAISLENQSGVVIEGNEMYDVSTNASCVLMVFECYGATRIVGNKIYTSHGAGAVGISNVAGTATVPLLLANNMIVCEDDGNANQMSTPLNIIQANYIDVLYNSVKLNAPTRNNKSAVSFGSGVLNNSRFVNNIVVCLDENNFALNYMPLNSTSNHVHHNVYFTVGNNLNRYSGTTCANVAAWSMLVSEDSTSLEVNPNFLNGSLVDLRTYNRQVKGVGMPISTVTTDMFGTTRNSTATCPGAFEFVSLNYDFEPEALINPVTSCYMPAQTELVVRMRNSGVNAYSGNRLKLHYVVNDGQSEVVNISQPIPSEDTATIHTGRMLTLPCNGLRDSVFSIQVWTEFSQDPNATNDTNVFTVISRHHPDAPGNVTMTVPYASSATFTPTVGVDSWQVYNSTAAPQRPSKLYWYLDSTDADPVHVGPSYTTGSLRENTELYFRQKRAKDLVRITQVEINRTSTGNNPAVGVTPIKPWLNNNRKLAVQLTNVGDDTAHLEGDTLELFSPKDAALNKIFVFPSVSIAPGQALVVQYIGGNTTNEYPQYTIHYNQAPSVAYNKVVALLLRRNGVIEDAMAINNINDAPASGLTAWSTLNVPAWVWIRSGVMGTLSNTAGYVRVAFDGKASDWRLATAEEPMFLDHIDSSWIRYNDNGCDGVFAVASAMIQQPPVADIQIDAPQLPEEGCHTEPIPVTVTVHNFGTQPVGSVTMHYNAGGVNVNQMLTGGIAAGGEVVFTFDQPITLGFPADSMVNVRVWCDALSADPLHANDTNQASVLVYYSPAMPAAMAPRDVTYATADEVTVAALPNAIPVWYDYDMNPVDTGYVHTTDILYGNGTMGVAYMALRPFTLQIGTGSELNGKNSYPAPYQPKNKYAKQQFIYSASELRALGMEAGMISRISFDLRDLHGKDSVSFDQYMISMGLTSDTIFSNNSAWKTSLEQVYSASPMTIRSSDTNNWVTHELNTPFYWDGVSSVVVQICHYIQTAISTGVQSSQHTKNNTALYKIQNDPLSPSLEEYVGAGTKNNKRPDVRFTSVKNGCVGPIREYQVNLIGVPQADVAVMWPAGIDTVIYNSCDSVDFYVNLRNQGLHDMDTLKLYYQIDTMAMDSTLVVDSIRAGHVSLERLTRHTLTPGRHTLTAVVSAPGDTIHANDTISRSFLVRFCGGSYTIAHEGGDYHSFTEAVDSLVSAGIVGSVNFLVADGQYGEQVVMGSVLGSSPMHTVTFEGVGDSAVLTAANTQAVNYVLKFEDAANVRLRNLTIFSNSASNVNFGHALVMQNARNIGVYNCHLMVRPTLNNKDGNCVLLQGNVSNLTMTGNVFENGYYALGGTSSVFGFDSITITGNEMLNFRNTGVSLRGVSNLDVESNYIHSSWNLNGKALVGLYVANSQNSFKVEKNKIYLVDTYTGGKVGMLLKKIVGTSTNEARIVNNMVSCSGTGKAGLPAALVPNIKCSAIWIDSSSNYVNVYFNSLRVYNGDPNSNVQYSDDSRTFFSGATNSHMKVMDNIFANLSKGYAYYVGEMNTVTSSNYNAYYTESARPFAWKTDTLSSMAALQAKNGDDLQSVFDEPYFISETDLHLLMTNFVTKALYLEGEVTDDIDGTVRTAIPKPTIGAHETPRMTHDMTVVRINSPVMPTNLNFGATNQPLNIEGDSVKVKARFYNNGRSNETNIRWFAYIEADSIHTRSATRSLGNFAPSEMKTDSLMMPTVLGLIGQQTVHVVLIAPNDTELDDNDLTAQVYLAPAFNLAVTRMTTQRMVSTAPTGCQMQKTAIGITLKNEGFKDFPANRQIEIGYHTEVASPANVAIRTMRDTVRQNISLSTPLLKNTSVTLTFDTLANLYPTDTDINITAKVIGWYHYEHDVSLENDTTNHAQKRQPASVESYYTPKSPINFDTVFPYGTWGMLRADQQNQRPIRWYRDSTAAPFYNPSRFADSKRWSPTPQYFHDSVYYLNCLSNKGCPSPFKPIHVYAAPRVTNDMAFVDVLAPLGGRVYMENDTVRVRVANYGTAPQSNVPICYILKRGAAVVDTITETIPGTIQPDCTVTYTFRTLLEITTPTTAQQYSLIIYTNLQNDQTRRNDTIRYYPSNAQFYNFRTLSESTYSTAMPTNLSFDITRISFNRIDLDMPPLGRGYTDLTSYNPRRYPELHVSRGEKDSIFIDVTTIDGSSQARRLKAAVYIDFQRNGGFNDPTENVVPAFSFYSNEQALAPITIDPNCSFGYMRMRVVVSDYEENISPNVDKNSHIVDFLLFVDEAVPATDLAVTHILEPRDYRITSNEPQTISFRVSNKGARPLSNITLHYRFDGDTIDPTAEGVVNIPETIPARSGASVELPPHVFPLGTSLLTIWPEIEGDMNHANDTLVYEYNRFHEVTLTLDDTFDDDVAYWYSPTSHDKYGLSHSLWKRGTPTKTRINAAFSEPNAWVTGLDDIVATGKSGNVSYLYSPIINIADIRADTISFYLQRNLIKGSTLHVEFLNYLNNWVRLVDDSCADWYNNTTDHVFDTNTSASTYTRHWISTAKKYNGRSSVSGNFNQNLQFRLVYTTPLTNLANATFGEGCAIDNFRIGRAQRPYDIGVIDITKPTEPRYGDTIWPEVVVKNFGSDTLTSFYVGYIPDKPNAMSKEKHVEWCNIPPNGVDTVQFGDYFILDRSFTSPFRIKAYTYGNSDDYYFDNDTCVKEFTLAPLDNDIAAECFLKPNQRVIAGNDAVEVQLRLYNFGLSPITNCTVSYIVNGLNRVDEEIDFLEVLGRPLETLEYFNYTFQEKFTASLGQNSLTGIVTNDHNSYVFNDTVTADIQGILSVMDLSAKEIIVDYSGFNEVRVQLVIENLGARGANGFEVGFYYYDDNTNTRIRFQEPYLRGRPLPALSTGYHMFNINLPPQSSGYNNVEAYVHVEGDNDSSNDTTTLVVPGYTDIAIEKVIVEETAEPDCRVFVVFRNVGNRSYVGTAAFKTTVNINGNRIIQNHFHRFEPGQAVLLEMNRRIPKNGARSYVGTGSFESVGDTITYNNQTTLIEVHNHVEGVPTVEENSIQLDQNFPNPFSHTTTIPFSLPNVANVRLFVVDALGHIVYSSERVYQAGNQSETLDLSNLPSGVYYYGIVVDGQRLMRKMLMR